MKSKIFNYCFAIIGIIFLFTNCSGPNPGVDDTFLPQENNVLKNASKTITQVEIDGIFYMREEEKLAHDVYYSLNELFPHPVFVDIMASEQTHTEAVLNLLNFYNLEDPVGDNGIGVFTDSHLQDLYDDLMEKGEMGLDSALIVGCLIEETDIIDIVYYIDQAKLKNIIQVYSNLLDGSENHLRAFVNAVSKQGFVYVPRYITQEEFDAIINE